MRWKGRRGSSNIEDRRGPRGKVAAGGGVIFIILALVVGLMGGDPMPLLEEGLTRTVETHVMRGGESRFSEEEENEMAEFTGVVLAETEDTWSKAFLKEGQDYPEPSLVMFTGAVQSACGFAQAAMGPFYCPRDQKIYIDLDFFYQLKARHDAPGDFAQAYVIAHEVGHHLQNIMGVLQHSDQLKRGLSSAQANEISVRTELMADCFAGVWAADTGQKGLLEDGDIEEALNAASQIGDDVLQKQAQGRVVPDSFTHGSGEQRYRWFNRGYRTGDPQACDTFSASDL